MIDGNRIQIYQSPDGETCVDVRFEQALEITLEKKFRAFLENTLEKFGVKQPDGQFKPFSPLFNETGH